MGTDSKHGRISGHLRKLGKGFSGAFGLNDDDEYEYDDDDDDSDDLM